MTVTLLSRHQLKNERGLLLYCSCCQALATAWKDGVPFCKRHWVPPWYMTRKGQV